MQNSEKKLNLIIDIDGVMTTGQFFYSEKGKVLKVFGPHDADGLKMIKNKANAKKNIGKLSHLKSKISFFARPNNKIKAIPIKTIHQTIK